MNGDLFPDVPLSLPSSVPPGIPPSLVQPWLEKHRPPYPWYIGQCEANAELAVIRAIGWRSADNLFHNVRFANHYASFRIVLLEFAMAKRSAAAKTFGKVDWLGFLERPLTEAELEELDGWKPKPVELFELVNHVTEDGYQIQASYSERMGGATATLQDRKIGRETAGWALSANDENAALALKAILYKHFTVLKSDWTPILGVKRMAKRG